MAKLYHNARAYVVATLVGRRRFVKARRITLVTVAGWTGRHFLARGSRSVGAVGLTGGEF